MALCSLIRLREDLRTKTMAICPWFAAGDRNPPPLWILTILRRRFSERSDPSPHGHGPRHGRGGGSPWLVGVAAAATMAMVVAMAAAMAVAMVAGVAVAAVVVCTGSLCFARFS